MTSRIDLQNESHPYPQICKERSGILSNYGGILLLGVHDSGRISGIDPSAVGQIKKDFVTTINNPQKIHPPAYLSVDDVQVQDQTILYVYVPESSQAHRCNGRTENSNKPHGFGVLAPSTFTPFPKNPVIGAFFREIHRADELGSGMRNMMHYGKAYGGEDPQMIEGDVFRIIVNVPVYRAVEKPAEQKELEQAHQQGGPVRGPVRSPVA